MTKTTSITDVVRPAVVKSLTDLLAGGHAHVTFEDAVKGIPGKYRGIRPEELPYSIWELVEHIRITQSDILEFSRDKNHTSPTWPDEYWPSASAPKEESDWENSLSLIKGDRDEFIGLLKDTENDLFEPFPYGSGQNLIREALLIADHTGYHTGQIIVIRRILGIW